MNWGIDSYMKRDDIFFKNGYHSGLYHLFNRINKDIYYVDDSGYPFNVYKFRLEKLEIMKFGDDNYVVYLVLEPMNHTFLSTYPTTIEKPMEQIGNTVFYYLNDAKLRKSELIKRTRSTLFDI